ncbi:MAG: hypothetical protein QOD51_2061 [Candidatus Eremiobacteraeota bacterium]|nr:hypothetical protein [Candidatus Eremiobacteraeota bacterium]
MKAGMMHRAWFLRCGAAAAVAAPAGFALPASAAPRIVDITPQLLPLVGRDDAATVAAFRATILLPNRAVYHAVLGIPVEEVGDERIRRYLIALAPHAARMSTISGDVHASADALLAHFLQTFADLAYDRRTYVLPTLFRFDGATRQVGGRPTLMFGIDGLASFYRPGTLRFPVIFDHELFHIYHQQVLGPQLASFASWPELYLGLWAEGLATYVSQRMNPGTPDGVALLDESLGAVGPRDVARLARRFLAEAGAGTASEAWFSGGHSSDHALPARAGYLLGLRAAQRIGGQAQLPDLARLYGTPLRTKIDEALHAIAEQTTPAP